MAPVEPGDAALDLTALRRSYQLGELREDDLAATWLEQFRRWFADAVGTSAIVEPNAIQLATADAQGRASVRTVLAKTIDDRGLVFFTHYDSAKARELAVHHWAEAVFAWLPLQRQVRLAGACEPVARAETEAYFALRPRGSQLSAWASHQSQVVAGREVLDRDLIEVERRFADMDRIPAPPDWGGYLLRPERVEFWQGRESRAHDRLRYRHDGGSWTVERLSP